MNRRSTKAENVLKKINEVFQKSITQPDEAATILADHIDPESNTKKYNIYHGIGSVEPHKVFHEITSQDIHPHHVLQELDKHLHYLSPKERKEKIQPLIQYYSSHLDEWANNHLYKDYGDKIP